MHTLVSNGLLVRELFQHSLSSCVSKTYDHLTVLGNLDSLALHNLHVVQPTQDLVLHLERGGHGELGALLDLEGLVLKRRLGAGRRQVDGHGRAAGRVQCQAVDDAHALVVWVREVLAACQAEGFLVALEGLVILVYGLGGGSVGARKRVHGDRCMLRAW